MDSPLTCLNEPSCGYVKGGCTRLGALSMPRKLRKLRVSTHCPWGMGLRCVKQLS